MTLTRHIIIAVFLSFIFIATSFAHGTGSHVHSKNDQGIEMARLWLKLVDEQKYNASWQTAAPVFKSAITFAQWEKTVTAVRVPLGDFIKRQLVHDKFTTTLPGMPDGDYLILRFLTTYKNKQSAVETVSMMKDEHDTWRVAGYFIK